MQQSASRFMVVAVLLLLVVMLSACGSDSGSTNAVASITVSPTSLSLNKGGTQSITATALNATSGTVLASFTYASSNTSIATVSPAGNVCAGTWDKNNIVCCPGTWNTDQTVCTPGMSVGSSTITVSTQGKSATVPVSVHDRVDLVKIFPPVGGCVSMAGTAQFTAKAYTKDTSVCSTAPQVPCEVTDSLGQFVFNSNDTAVVTFDNTTADKNGVATAGIPGETTVFASLSRNNSAAATFQTCPITSLSITVKDSTTAPFAFDKGATKQLVATAVDSSGKTLTAPPIDWFTSQPFAVTVPLIASTDPLNANATASAPGTSTLLAACTSPSCNRNLNPVFSNLITATVNGTATGVVYAASTTSKSVVPIDMATNTAGTAITVPNLPNSFLSDRIGSNAILGSDTSAMLLNLSSNTASSLGVIGRVLAFAPDGGSYAFSSPTNNVVSVIATSTTGSSGSFVVPGGADAADYSADSRYLFAIKGDKIYRFNISLGSFETLIGAATKDVATLAQGSAALVTIPGQVQARATCNSALIGTKGATNPTLVAAVPNGDGALVYDDGSLVRISNVTLDQACPPLFNADSNTIDIHGGSAVARQLLVSPDSKKAFVTTNTGNLLTYDLSSGAATPIQLVGATEAYRMAISLDSKMLYVGAKDGKVHRIDTTSMSDVQQIDPGLKQTDGTTVAVPDLIVIRNK